VPAGGPARAPWGWQGTPETRMDIVVFALSALALALALVALAVPLAQRIDLPLPVAIAGAGLVAGTTAALGRVAECVASIS